MNKESMVIANTVKNVNLAETGQVTLFTPSVEGLSFIPVAIVIYCSAGSNLTSGPTISVGTDSGTWENVIPSTPMNTFVNVNNYLRITVSTMAVPVNRNISMMLNISSAANGSQTATIFVEGFYVNSADLIKS